MCCRIAGESHDEIIFERGLRAWFASVVGACDRTFLRKSERVTELCWGVGVGGCWGGGAQQGTDRI